MEYLIPWILGIGFGTVTLLVWLWLSAERDLNKNRREMEIHESEKRRLSEELNDLKQELLNRENRLHEAATQDHEVANQQSRLRSHIAELRRKLDDSQGKIFELGEAKRDLAIAQARGGGDAEELIRLNDRIAELAQDLAKDEARLLELDHVCERLSEGERIRQVLREENARHQVQLEHWRQRSVESEASERRLALIQEQFGELLTMQAALAEAQRRFQDALVAFAGMTDSPSKPVVQTITFEQFRSGGDEAQPIDAGNAPESIIPQQPAPESGARLTEAQRESGFMPKLRNLKAPKVG